VCLCTWVGEWVVSVFCAGKGGWKQQIGVAGALYVQVIVAGLCGHCADLVLEIVP
jgi:hypothetical protein